MPSIEIKFVDGYVVHSSIAHAAVKDQILIVTTDEGDELRYSPSYWQAYVVDPKSNDPLDLRG